LHPLTAGGVAATELQCVVDPDREQAKEQCPCYSQQQGSEPGWFAKMAVSLDPAAPGSVGIRGHSARAYLDGPRDGHH
jgi:hypothetical protein